MVPIFHVKLAPPKFTINRRAVASAALVTVLSAIEKQRKAKSTKPGDTDIDFATQDMSGELQTIPARHGVATFVPRGRTIKIINTYGKQVVSTWAFSLGVPPEEGVDEDEEADVEGMEEVGELKKGLETDKEEKTDGEDKVEEGDKDNEELAKAMEKEEVEEPKEEAKKPNEEVEERQEQDQPKDTEEKEDQQETAKDDNTAQKEDASKGSDDPPEQAPDTAEKETSASEQTKETSTKSPTQKRTWASYIPSIPYRSKNQQNKTNSSETVPDPKADQKQAEATSKKWSSYLPTGKGFSSYVPNVQLPDSQNVISSFQASHYRDPNKSYAEQLYDFSKTPVGAGGIAAATGSGTASSIYAAYSAYTKLSPSANDIPPMEYLSLPHTRAASNRLVPNVDDTLLTNLRNPIITLIEDTSPGAHDTLTTACDASLYAALNVSKPEEHGSCAENLVLALKELNEKAGLKGTKAVGADITVNITPTPLHLFMNAPINVPDEAQVAGAGAKSARFSVEEPQGKKRSYVRFRAERDIVVVLSACPMDVGKQNGGKCMAANFMVEDAAEEDLAASTASVKKLPRKLNKGKTTKKEEGKTGGEEKGADEAKKETKTSMPRPRGGVAKVAAVKKSAEDASRDSKQESDDPSESELPEEVKKGKEEANAQQSKSEDSKQEEPQPVEVKKEEPKQKESQPVEEEPKSEEAPKPKKKPKKLERRSAGSSTPAKSS